MFVATAMGTGMDVGRPLCDSTFVLGLDNSDSQWELADYPRRMEEFFLEVMLARPHLSVSFRFQRRS